MQILKRDGRKVEFNRQKIVNAIKKSFRSVDGEVSDYASEKAENIADYIAQRVNESDKPFDVEMIQDLVEHGLMSCKRKDVAKAYILYRDERNRNRKNTTQRDYIAGEVSKDATDRYLLPKDIVEANKAGILHFHDADYFIQHMHNCDLINIDDMLQNGTVISETMIEKPHSFSTACTITTQIISQVASAQYGLTA